ncbi:beta-ketoacyl synthase N-terminal-like domain-containing protein [Shewanella sp. cp20]|uniref:beta-ketoacyl synthase N-terminal-like domain-containing protein n=1 Tax=Shewanella sp. cp20 TaxID=1521167 RepID=UPI0005A0DBA3|nr:beta-ketoacyl synthase N-terminal-like domain-containing protein [Shewanella sp. cp20]KIO37225.1 beta-hydroxyacyl-ACP dehydratase [Shewanella sp. cp20]
MPSHQAPSPKASDAADNRGKIAIVGLANLYPDAKTPKQFWQNLLDKRDSRSQLSDEKLGARLDDYRGKQGEADRFYCDKGGYIQDFHFNAYGYQLPPEQLQGLDDSLLWALDTSRNALLDAGIELDSPLLSRTGIIMGTLSFPTAKSNELFLPLYHKAVEKALSEKLACPDFHLSPFKAHQSNHTLDCANGAIAHNASKLVADALGLGRVSLSLDAACASSVYSLKLACDYLSSGKADLMLAGAVSGADPFFINMGFSIFHAYPDHGFSAPFDSNTKGLFAGEGAGVLALKRLEDAERDGDKIYGLIAGIGLSNDGKGQFVLSPNSKGQVKAFERAYRQSGLAPKQIEVIECHATGTPLGDKVELASMEQFFAPQLEGAAPPLIGSAKSNLAHLLTAAGMPGIMKMIFAMNQGELPPSINLSEAIASPNGLFGSHTLPREVTPWPVKVENTARLAGVSVFGFGGCNAHLLLESYDQAADSAAKLAPQQALAHRAASTETAPTRPELMISGLAAHFGPLADIQAMDACLKTGRDPAISLPARRWKGLEQHPELLAQFGLNHVPQGAYVDSFELDFLRFKLPPNEDDRLIGQQLMLMKVTDEAICDAGLQAGQKVAVLVAMETELELHQFRGRVNLHTQLKQSLDTMGATLSEAQYRELEALTMDSVLDAAKLNQYTSFIGNIMASRIAALWDFSGPAFTISAGEQSVARAIDVAENMMQHEQLDAVVIAAVDLCGSLEQVILKNAIAPVASPANPEGWRLAEGAGALVLETQASQDARGAKAYGQLTGLHFGAQRQLARLGDQLLSQSITAQTKSGTTAEQVGLTDLNAAPGSQYGEQQLMAMLPLPAAKQVASSRRLGHSFAAAGMNSLIATLLTMAHEDARQAISVTCSEDQAALIQLSQNQTQASALTERLAQPLPQPERRLIKRVSLGGRDLVEHIIGSPLSQQAEIQALLQNGLLQGAGGLTGKPSRHQPPQKFSYLGESNTAYTANESQHAPAHSGAAGMSHTMSPKTAQTPGLQASATDNGAFSQLQHQAALYQAQNQQLARQAHLAYLKSRESGLKLADSLLKQQLAQAQSHSAAPQTSQAQASTQHSVPQSAPQSAPQQTLQSAATTPLQPKHHLVAPYRAPVPEHKPCIWDYHDLVEYAEGDIAKVFGPEYAAIDGYSRRVRLPTTDYLLVSRVTKLDAKLGEYKPSTMTTEYDIPVDAPYLVDGQIPWAVAVESGQCDLMLISYLGIDLENKGERVYRLLDCTLTFLGDLPRGGDTLRYEIKINNFARNGDTLLFFFSYECFVGDTMILKMDGGCAGFFTDAELADGKGVIRTEEELLARSRAAKQTFNPILDCPRTQFDYADIHKLLSADIQGCFGPSHAGPAQPSLCFASEKFLMIEAVSKVERSGGAWGLGLLEGHKQLEPNHWYFPCHFKDDQVMAGSLMAEGCGQLLQFYMLHLGMHTQTQNGRFQPLENASQKVRCRGQVIPQSAQLTYRMEVTEIGFSPRPYAKANIDILLDGKVVVDFQNLGVMIKEEAECTRYPELESRETSRAPKANQRDSSSAPLMANAPLMTNAPLMAQIPDLNAEPNKGVIPLTHVEAPLIPDYPNRVPDTVPFTPYHLFEFATGDIEKCFGPEFAIYRGMIPPRTPCGDLQLTTRVIEVNGQRGDFKRPASCIAEYEVPQDAWYFDANSHQALMPYSVMMEIALQPNGFISGYMGTTLGFPGLELFFRNLDGSGELLRKVDLHGKTIVNDSRLLSTVMAGTNIIQSFSFELSTDGEPFYRGTAVFGYFKAEALKDQLGLDNGKTTQPWHQAKGIAPDIMVNLLDKDGRHFTAPASQPHYRLAGGQLNFIDSVEIVDNGGSHGLGYLYAERTIDPSDWFFQFHFHQDPVMPGSLGVEAIIETMQTYAISKDLGAGFSNPKFGQILSNIKWKYRGQINPLNKQMSMDVSITSVERQADKLVITGNASLSKDGLRIYEVSDIAICIEEA